MSKLEDFLSLGNATDTKEKIEVTVLGKKLNLTIRVMSEDEHKAWQKQSMTIGKKGSVSLDLGKYNSLMVPACIVEPNFNDAEFLSKAKCVCAWDFLNSRFPAGVIEDISTKIQTLSGFESGEKDIEDAKN